jgi:hypothetical protein
MRGGQASYKPYPGPCTCMLVTLVHPLLLLLLLTLSTSLLFPLLLLLIPLPILQVRNKFEALGGTVLEQTGIDGITVHPDGAQLATTSFSAPSSSSSAASASRGVTARLVIDCMGHASPIVRQLR